jgi:hypothetical protein
MIPRHALTVQECEGATPPHQRRAANHVRGGLRVTCMLCGVVLESPRRCDTPHVTPEVANNQHVARR